MVLSARSRLSDDSGFTIIEVMVAALVLLVGLLATLTLVDTANSTTATTKAREQATNLQRELIEAARTIPFDQLTPHGVGARLRSQPGLGDASLTSAGWTIRRRNVTYSISMGSCAVDDPRDGLGAHDVGVFCANSGAPTTPEQCASVLDGGSGAGVATPGDCGVDTNLDGDADGLTASAASSCPATPCADTAPLDYKRVVSLVRWTVRGTKQWQLQLTTVNSPGVSAAPTITDLRPTNLPGGGTVMTSGDTVAFTATASRTPTAMGWYVEGTLQSTTSVASSTWTFSWDLGSTSTSNGAQPAPQERVDGDYLVSVKGFDEYGQFGQPRSVNITVNRRKPFAPIDVRAGRNGSAVDIAWTPNKEGDLRGYNVYRKASSGPDVKVCALVVDVSCRDATAPASGALQYYATAVETDAAGAREGDASTAATVNNTNTPPNPPTSLQASPNGGNTVLTWHAPSPGDRDSGDFVDHYVIYRDGQAYADRYDRTATGADLTWTDTHTNGQVHRYWVTSVDTQLGESVFLGPVSS
jgi:prepilin-type N-terminal cleavage/methylation domain-containing protein